MPKKDPCYCEELHVTHRRRVLAMLLCLQVLEDPSGNSFIENTFAPSNDPHLTCYYFKRSVDQDKQLGLKVGTQGFTALLALYNFLW